MAQPLFTLILCRCRFGISPSHARCLKLSSVANMRRRAVGVVVIWGLSVVANELGKCKSNRIRVWLSSTPRLLSSIAAAVGRGGGGGYKKKGDEANNSIPPTNYLHICVWSIHCAPRTVEWELIRRTHE